MGEKMASSADDQSRLSDLVKEGTTLTKQLVEQSKDANWQLGIDHYDQTIELAVKLDYCDIKKLYSNRSLCHVKMGLAQKNKDPVKALGHMRRAEEDAADCIKADSEFVRGYERKVKALEAQASLPESDNSDILQRWEAAADAWCTATEKDPATKQKSSEARAKLETEKVHRKLRGKWSGTVSPDLGGYPQEYNFIDNDTIKVTVLTNTIEAKYQISTKQKPYTMDIIIIPPGQTQPQVAPYIFQFQDEAMEMCCPCGVVERPTKFEGGGLVTMEKKALVQDDDEEKKLIEKMDIDEKIEKYIEAFIKELGHERIVKQGGIPEAQADPETAMEISRVEIRLVMLKLKYGMDVGETVDVLINKLMTGEDIPPELAKHKKSAGKLKKQLQLTGFIAGPDVDEVSEADKLKQEFRSEQAINRAKKRDQTPEEIKAEFDSINCGKPIGIPKLKEYLHKRWNIDTESAEKELETAVQLIMASVDLDGNHVMDLPEFTAWYTGKKTQAFQQEVEEAKETVLKVEAQMKGEEAIEENIAGTNWLVIGGAVAAAAAIVAWWATRKK